MYLQKTFSYLVLVLGLRRLGNRFMSENYQSENIHSKYKNVLSSKSLNMKEQGKVLLVPFLPAHAPILPEHGYRPAGQRPLCRDRALRRSRSPRGLLLFLSVRVHTYLCPTQSNGGKGHAGNGKSGRKGSF